MLMNSNELLLKINHVLQDSGIIDDVTDFFHEHPEYFTKCSYDKDIISFCDINIAMCCKPIERQDADVFVLIDLGTHDATHISLTDHSRSTGSKVVLRRTINDKEVSNYVCN